MTTIVALAVLLSTLMHAFWNALVKGGDSPGWQEIAASGDAASLPRYWWPTVPARSSSRPEDPMTQA